MKTISSEKGKLLIEINENDMNLISGLFEVISTDTGSPTPWSATDYGDGESLLNDEKFYDLWKRWNALTDAPEAKDFFKGDK